LGVPASRPHTTLVRFDAVYHGHFKCNREEADGDTGALGVRLRPVPRPGFGDRMDFDRIKRHYYEVHRDINPTESFPWGPPSRLVDAPPPRAAGRPPVRRRHAAASAAQDETVPADRSPLAA
jgi:putative glutathione S-transferase